jgi:hypothetical protein
MEVTGSFVATSPALPQRNIREAVSSAREVDMYTPQHALLRQDFSTWVLLHFTSVSTTLSESYESRSEAGLRYTRCYS